MQTESQPSAPLDEPLSAEPLPVRDGAEPQAARKPHIAAVECAAPEAAPEPATDETAQDAAYEAAETDAQGGYYEDQAEFDPYATYELRPRIVVVGVGGAGCNAVNNMIDAGLDGVEFVAANTDAQALIYSKADVRLQLGRRTTSGLGAGGDPRRGEAAAEESLEAIADLLQGAHMVFVASGMGGGTGTGASPVIARIARECGALTVSVVTKPFIFEGPVKMRRADQGLLRLAENVDAQIVIPNQNLYRIIEEETSFVTAFRMADEVLHQGVRSITDLMVRPGHINLDFADVRAIMEDMGPAIMGAGEAEGENRALKAAELAILNPLFDDVSVRGARSILVNIASNGEMSLREIDAAVSRVRSEAMEDALVACGVSIDPSLEARVRVSVVATGVSIEGAAVEPRSSSGQAEAPPPQAADHNAPAPAAAASVEQPARQAPSVQPLIQRPAEAAAPPPKEQAVAEPVATPAAVVDSEPVAQSAIAPESVTARMSAREEAVRTPAAAEAETPAAVAEVKTPAPAPVEPTLVAPRDMPGDVTEPAPAAQAEPTPVEIAAPSPAAPPAPRPAAQSAPTPQEPARRAPRAKPASPRPETPLGRAHVAPRSPFHSTAPEAPRRGPGLAAGAETGAALASSLSGENVRSSRRPQLVEPITSAARRVSDKPETRPDPMRVEIPDFLRRGGAPG